MLALHTDLLGLYDVDLALESRHALARVGKFGLGGFEPLLCSGRERSSFSRLQKK
jgi:hypothetical protein